MNGDSLLLMALLVGALAVFVVATAAEAAVAFISRERVRAYATKGLPRAASLASYVQERRAMLGTLAIARAAAVVLGLCTAAFLVLGETGHTWVAFAAIMGGGLAVVVVLEAVPRLLVARSPERWSLRLVPAMGVLRFVFAAPARALEALALSVLRLRGRSEQPFEPAKEEDDLLRLVELHEGNGESAGELTMIRRVTEMGDTAVREIMVPRIDMVSVDTEATLDDVVRLVLERGYSRIPLYEETNDNIVGVVYAKDILRYLADGRRPNSLREIARPPYVVPEGKRIDELLAEMRKSKVHMAIVVDEYGGTAGLVTIEDILEEIVGEIQDEYDREEVTVHRINDNEAIVDARLSVYELNELLGLEIEGEDFDTVGGFVYHQLGRMPAPGDEVFSDGLKLRVLSTVGRRIKQVQATRQPPAEEQRNGGGNGTK